MSLVLSIIAFMWLLIAVLVNFTQDKKAGSPTEQPLETSLPLNASEQKKRAAVAAVAYALAHKQAREPYSFALPPTANVSAWQAVNRTEMLHKHGKIR